MGSGGGTSDKLLDEIPPCSSDQEAPRRRSSTEIHPSLDVSGEVFDGGSLKGLRLECDDGVSPWASLQPDILGIVLRFLPCLPDRASVRSVCHHWRASARIHALPPPLPLLVLPQYRISSLSASGELMPARRVPVPKEMAADDLRFVGSFDGWLVGVTRNKKQVDWFYRDSDGDCLLVNAFSRKFVRLPKLCTMRFSYSGLCKQSVPIINGSDEVYFRGNDVYAMSICKAVLSAPPDSGSKYIVAACSNHRVASTLALWKPGMSSWQICLGTEIAGPRDLAFYQGKLYILLRSKICLLACEFEENDCGPDRGLIFSRVERCLTTLPPHHPFKEGGAISCNMVVWHGELLLIIRHYDDNPRRQRRALKVEVFALDVSIKPYGVTEIHSFNGDCIFVGSGGCKSFPAGLHDGVEGDLIYFGPDDWKPYDTFVYSMRDRRMRPFADELLSCDSEVPANCVNFPVWLLPSE